jgi:hypothetical protein
MKITLNEIKQIIQEVLLQEQIFGAQAYVYHGSQAPPDAMLDLIKNKKFNPGEGAGGRYGQGLYTIREIDPKSNTFYGLYGHYVYKFKVNLAGIVSFDPGVTQQIYGKQLSIIDQIQLIIDKNLVGLAATEKLKKFLKQNKNQSLGQEKYDDYSSDAVFENWKELIPYVKGISFTGRRDGKVIVFYSLDGVVPIAWTRATITAKNPSKVKAKDYVWNKFELGSLTQNQDYQNFKSINIDQEMDRVIKNIDKENSEKNILKFIDLNANAISFGKKLEILELKNLPPKILEKFLEKFSNDHFYHTRYLVAMHPNTPIHVLENMTDDEYVVIRMEMASRLKSNPKILEKLSNDKEYHVRKQVAEITKQADILEKLSKDQEFFVREIVSLNPDIPIDVMNNLSKDENVQIRMRIARNSNCTLPIFKKLSYDKDAGVRQAVAHNEKTPIKILEKLSNDEDPHVRGSLIYNPNCTLPIFEKLSKDENQSIKINLAVWKNTPLDILKKLAYDKDDKIKSALLNNPSITKEILEILINDTSQKIVNGAKKLLSKMKKEAKNENLIKIINKLINEVSSR